MLSPDIAHESDPIERDFFDALKRLEEGKPKHKNLKAAAKAGKLKINTSNVALEAGRSRTLIALENCRYPKVREAIKIIQGAKKSPPTTYTQLIESLRASLAQLKAEKRILEMKIGDHVLSRRRAEIESRRDAAEAARLRKRVVELEKIAQLPRRDTSLPRLVLIRGMPGSGKTTLAMGFKVDGYVHFEADQYFLADNEYRFEARKLPAAHAWCLEQTRVALEAGEFVCVSNVFGTVEDIKPYTQLSMEFQIVESTYPGKSVHNIPLSAIHAMEKSWIPTDRLVEILEGTSRKKATVTPIRTPHVKST
ncbi:hypothetical protein [Chitinimonas sp. JJ19]|uniref:hypothetical protein n=1 Tax=Chitinimonas sp. JJ19 TaxID=3109352 RepID=UPI003002B227